MTRIDWLQSLRYSLRISRRTRRSLRRRKRRPPLRQVDTLETRIPLGDTFGVGAFLAGGMLAAPALPGLIEDAVADETGSPEFDREDNAPADRGDAPAAWKPEALPADYSSILAPNDGHASKRVAAGDVDAAFRGFAQDTSPSLFADVLPEPLADPRIVGNTTSHQDSDSTSAPELPVADDEPVETPVEPRSIGGSSISSATTDGIFVGSVAHAGPVADSISNRSDASSPLAPSAVGEGRGGDTSDGSHAEAEAASLVNDGPSNDSGDGFALLSTTSSGTGSGSGSGSGSCSGNTAPTANDDHAYSWSGHTIQIYVLSNDTDPEGNELTITDVSQPSKGTATNDLQSVSYEANTDATGSDSFTYTIEDACGNTDTATINVSFVDVSDWALERQKPDGTRVSVPDG